MRALTGRVLNADPERWYRIRIDYAGLVRIRHGSCGPALEFVNAAALR
jgi:probable phosphoglycerate mutase